MSSANYFDEDFVPGTSNIYVSKETSSVDSNSTRKIKRSKNGVVLLPQPSDSPNDPLNWSFSRKTWHFAVLSFITALTAATSNDAGAAQESLNSFYGITYEYRSRCVVSFHWLVLYFLCPRLIIVRASDHVHHLFIGWLFRLRLVCIV